VVDIYCAYNRLSAIRAAGWEILLVLGTWGAHLPASRGKRAVDLRNCLMMTTIPNNHSLCFTYAKTVEVVGLNNCDQFKHAINDF
jgi:hypothetical protein